MTQSRRARRSRPAASGLRRATPDDYERIAALERLSFDARSGRFSPRQLRALLSNPRAFWLLAAGGGAMACWLEAGNGRRRWARLYSIAVHPELRGQGFAERLIKAGFAWMARRGLSVCRAEVKRSNLAARRLYARLGFQEAATLPDYYGPKQHGLRLVKWLKPPRARSPRRTRTVRR